MEFVKSTPQIPHSGIYYCFFEIMMPQIANIESREDHHEIY